MTATPSSKPYPSFNDPDPKALIIHRMHLQAHHYAQIQQSIFYLTTQYKETIEQLSTIANKNPPKNAVLEPFGPEPVPSTGYLLSPMTKQYWEETKEKPIEMLEAIEKTGEVCLKDIREWEAKIRAEVLACNADMVSAREEKGAMENVEETYRKGGGG